jgi:lipid-binding SYLF domain-containing protein
MTKSIIIAAAAVATLGFGSAAYAGKYEDTTTLFKDSSRSSDFFNHSYAYALFPTVGEGGLLIGAAHGDGKVYLHGHAIGRTAVTQLSVGFQAGGEAFSEIVFFKDKAALDTFESGTFQFGAGASVVVITAAAGADVGTEGSGAGASGDSRDNVATAAYVNGMAAFAIVKGGAMFNASLEGEKFSYSPGHRS